MAEDTGDRVELVVILSSGYTFNLDVPAAVGTAFADRFADHQYKADDTFEMTGVKRIVIRMDAIQALTVRPLPGKG